jgi:GT2 family glycosyltransferase
MRDIKHIDHHRSEKTEPRQNISVRGETLPADDGAALSPQPRPVVVVLGMHRSGTSLLSNMLHVLGVDMADTTDHVSPKNPGGFWERPELVAIHDEILDAIGRPIALPSHVLPFAPAWWRSKPVQALKPKLVDYVGEQLAKSSNPWGFKDPRTCRLLPLWWEVFRELNLEPVYINAFRAPSEAAVSMSQKSSARKLSVANSELMWLSYNYDIARYVTLKSRAVVVDYAEWFADPNAVAQRLCRELGIGMDLSPVDIAECAASIVQADYRNQFAESADSTSVAGMFYKSLTAPNLFGEDELHALRGQVRLVQMFFKSIAPVVRDLDTAASDLTTLQRELDASLAEITRLHEEHDSIKQSLATESSSRKHAESRLHRQRKRSRALVRKARQWRDTYIAEHGDRNDRLEVVAQTAELQRLLALTERRLAAAEDERIRFVAELELRDRALAELRRARVDQVASRESEERVFTWPSDGAPLKISGGIDRVDGLGVSGHVDVGGRNDVVPVVEVRVDGVFVTAQTSLAAQRVRGRSSRQPWRFSFSWEQFGLELAGKQAVVLVAGTAQELGAVTVPADLRRYHLSPAARAAAELGGTLAEAAEYQRWLIECEGPEDADLARAYRTDAQAQWPRITIIVYGDDVRQLQITLQSLRDQVYADWKALCIDAAGAAAEIDPRVSVVARKDIGAELEDEPADALFTFMEAGDVLGSTALLHLAEAARANPDFALIYSDEDRIDPESGLRAVPHMKGAWSPDLALAQDYVARMALVRRDKLEAKAPLDGPSIYEQLLKAALSGSGPVVHLPFVLYHRAAANVARPQHFIEASRSAIESTPALSGAKLVSDAEGRTKVEWPLPKPEPRVSLIVPTRDRPELLRVCVNGFLNETRYDSLEVVIADNDSQEEETKAYLSKISKHPRVRVIPCPGPFNFSKINNIAAGEAAGELIGLMNNDLKVFDPDWLQQMVRHAVRPDVGIVGAKLLYDDGTIQHAGVTLGIALASHLYKFAAGDAEGRQGRLSLTQDVSAVTAACLLMRRDVWDEVQGLDEGFPVAYNDVDLCLKVRTAGYRIVWTPDAVLYHLESRSRGKDVTPEKRKRLEQDKERLIDRWGELLASDPFHNPNLSANHIDARLSFPIRVAAPWQPAIAAQ